jgi:hypothetical protein
MYLLVFAAATTPPSPLQQMTFAGCHLSMVVVMGILLGAHSILHVVPSP